MLEEILRILTFISIFLSASAIVVSSAFLMPTRYRNLGLWSAALVLTASIALGIWLASNGGTALGGSNSGLLAPAINAILGFMSGLYARYGSQTLTPDQLVYLLTVMPIMVYGVGKIALGGLLHAYIFIRRYKAIDTPPLTPRQHRLGNFETHVRYWLLLIGLGLAVLPILAEQYPVVATYASSVFWAGVWLLALECYGYIWLTIRQRAAPGLNVSGDDVTLQKQGSVRKLYQDYLETYQELLFFREASRPTFNRAIERTRAEQDQQSAHYAGPDSAWLERLNGYAPNWMLWRLNDADEHFQSGKSLLFPESFTSMHTLLLMELMQRTRHNGEVVLVICADEFVDQFVHLLEQQMDMHQIRLGDRWSVWGRDAHDFDPNCDLLICPDVQIDMLFFDRFDSMQPFFNNLGLITCLNGEDLNLSGLRLGLSRFKNAFSDKQPRFCLQAEFYNGIENQLDQLPGIGQVYECPLNAEVGATRYQLAWDANPANRALLQDRYFKGLAEPVEMGLLLQVSAWRDPPITTLYLDLYNRINADALEQLHHRLFPRYGHIAVLGGLLTMSSGSIKTMYDRIAVVVEDNGNLPVALSRNVDLMGSNSAIIHVIVNNYLLRNFFRACIAAGASMQHLSLHLRPLATRPRGNLRQLATGLLSVLDNAEGVPRDILRDRFFNLVDEELLNIFAIRPTAAGLRKLYATVLPATPVNISVIWDQRGEPRYRLTGLDDRARIQPLPVRDQQGEIIASFDPFDHGLHYAAGVYWLSPHDHKFYRIKSVTQQVNVERQDDPYSKLRQRYYFHRSYQLDSSMDYPVVHVGERSENNRLWRSIDMLTGPVQRTTQGFVSFDEDCLPLAASESGRGHNYRYHRLSQPVVIEHSYTQIARLRFADMTTKPNQSQPDHSQTEQSQPQQPQTETKTVELRKARIVYTLCTVLQEILRSMFPHHHERLAVISPDCNILFDADNSHDNNSGRADSPAEYAFLQRIYPSLNSAGIPNDRDGIEIYIIEDACYDLGVVNRICDQSGDRILLGMLRDYLNWALTQPQAELFQAFGGNKLSHLFDYQAAARLADELAFDSQLSLTGDIHAEALLESDLQAEDTDSFCDFCSNDLSKHDYHKLDDGRCRCHACDDSAIDTLAEFKIELDLVITQMEARYKINLPRDITVKFADAEEIARAQGESFSPTGLPDIRAIGLAVLNRHGEISMLIENGAPRLRTRATLAHELTHVWQMGCPIEMNRVPLHILEGQARFVEIDYLNAFGGEQLASRIQQQTENNIDKDDVYAKGYAIIREQCRPSPRALFTDFLRMLIVAND